MCCSFIVLDYKYVPNFCILGVLKSRFCNFNNGELFEVGRKMKRSHLELSCRLCGSNFNSVEKFHSMNTRMKAIDQHFLKYCLCCTMWF